MTKQEAIYWFEKAIDVYEIFPIENDIKLESYKIAVNSLKAQDNLKYLFKHFKHFTYINIEVTNYVSKYTTIYKFIIKTC